MPDDGAYIGTCPSCKKVVAVMMYDPWTRNHKDVKEAAEFSADNITKGRTVHYVTEDEIPALDMGHCRCGKS